MPELKGRDISRTLLGRGAAYYLIYTGLSIYIAVLVPRIFGLPQYGRFGDILVFLLFYLAALCHIQPYLQQSHHPPRNRIRTISVHVTCMSVPHWILMAGNSLPRFLEAVLLYLPIHFRRTCFHQPEQRRLHPRHDCPPTQGPCHPDCHLLHTRLDPQHTLSTETPPALIFLNIVTVFCKSGNYGNRRQHIFALIFTDSYGMS